MVADKLRQTKMIPGIRQFDNAEWPKLASMLIQSQIDSIVERQGQCSVMLTGGRSAERLYGAWSKSPEFQSLKGVRFYFGDERCVPADHPDSNYGMVMRSLFQRSVPTGCSVFSMDGADPDHDAAAMLYEKALPGKMDVLLLGVGEDGHIASLFPGSEALLETGRRVVPVVGPKLPYDRLTITPPVISRAGAVFVLAAGAAKAALLSNILAAPDNDVIKIPARLALHATWLLDAAVPSFTLTESR
jgi:6-phosphogluconolactonase